MNEWISGIMLALILYTLIYATLKIKLMKKIMEIIFKIIMYIYDSSIETMIDTMFRTMIVVIIPIIIEMGEVGIKREISIGYGIMAIIWISKPMIMRISNSIKEIKERKIIKKVEEIIE